MSPMHTLESLKLHEEKRRSRYTEWPFFQRTLSSPISQYPLGDRAKSQSSGSLKQKEVTLLGWTDSILAGHCLGTQTNVQHSEDPGIQVPMFHQNGAILNDNLDF